MARLTRHLDNLPAEATTFIGRRRELAELRKKLAAGRLVSLVGPGGVGKTHLAIRMVRARFPDRLRTAEQSACSCWRESSGSRSWDQLR
jgi:MoxR-like ATPase